jgi:hypothetical protein
MKFNRIILGAGALVAAAGLATVASAAGSVSANATATATILSPVTLLNTQAMAFGSIVRPSTGANTVTLNTTNGVALTGGGDAALQPSTKTSAKFSITAPAGQTYTPSAVLTMTGLTGVAAGTPAVDTGTVGALAATATTQVITYGGQFDVSSSTTPQLYSGTLALTISYP